MIKVAESFSRSWTRETVLTTANDRQQINRHRQHPRPGRIGRHDMAIDALHEPWQLWFIEKREFIEVEIELAQRLRGR